MIFSSILKGPIVLCKILIYIVLFNIIKLILSFFVVKLKEFKKLGSNILNFLFAFLGRLISLPFLRIYFSIFFISLYLEILPFLSFPICFCICSLILFSFVLPLNENNLLILL